MRENDLQESLNYFKRKMNPGPTLNIFEMNKAPKAFFPENTDEWKMDSIYPAVNTHTPRLGEYQGET